MTQQHKGEEIELYEAFAKKYQYDIMSIQEGYANFKEWDGDGYFKVKKTLEEVKKDLLTNQLK